MVLSVGLPFWPPYMVYISHSWMHIKYIEYNYSVLLLHYLTKCSATSTCWTMCWLFPLSYYRNLSLELVHPLFLPVLLYVIIKTHWMIKKFTLPAGAWTWPDSWDRWHTNVQSCLLLFFELFNAQNRFVSFEK